MKKRLINVTTTSLILAMLLPIGVMLTPALAIDSPFTDVRPDDWFYPYVNFVYENNIMQGTSTTTFSPNQDFTRAQVAATLFRVHYGRAADTSDSRDNDFTDVPENEWFAPYVSWASENGIVNGVGNNLFAPADYVTKQQFATMLHRFADSLTGLSTRAWRSTEWFNFTDLNLIASWAENGLRWGNFHGIISGRTDTTLAPRDTVSRAEAAAMLARFVQLMRDYEPAFSVDDFELTISVEETTLLQGENFIVNVELKNNSGEDLEITYDVNVFFFLPYIQGWNWLFDDLGVITHPWSLQRSFLEAGDTLRNIRVHGRDGDPWTIGSALEPGTHELRFRAVFYLNWSQANEQQIRIYSNTIELTVTEREFSADDFELTISVDETTLPRGENFRVDVELKNNSVIDLFIFYWTLLQPYVTGVEINHPTDEVVRIERFFEANSVLRNRGSRDQVEVFYFDSGVLEPGTHELRFRAVFYFNWRQVHEQQIIVYSNPITITVK